MKRQDNDTNLTVQCVFHLKGLDCKNHGKLIAEKPVIEALDTTACIESDTIETEKVTYESTESILFMKHEKPETKNREQVAVSIPETLYVPAIEKEKIEVHTEKISTFRPMEQSYLLNDYGLLLSVVLTSYAAYRYILKSGRYWSSLIEDLKNV